MLADRHLIKKEEIANDNSSSSINNGFRQNICEALSNNRPSFSYQNDIYQITVLNRKKNIIGQVYPDQLFPPQKDFENFFTSTITTHDDQHATSSSSSLSNQLSYLLFTPDYQETIGMVRIWRIK